MDKDSKIYIAGRTGLLGSKTILKLNELGYENIIHSTHKELDLTNQKDTEDFFCSNKPDYVFVMAGKVGGIKANSENMAEFAMENLQIALNIINAAHKTRVKKMIYLGSSCMYPAASLQPIKEEYLLSGEFEPTNEGYAIAKVAGVKLCEYFNRQYGDNFISCIPANIYGPGDNFINSNSHVIPALIKRFHYSKINEMEEVLIWGTGKPVREFLYIDDAVDACIFLMNHYDSAETINVGVGSSTSIKELAYAIKDVVAYSGKIIFDSSQSDGMPIRILDSSKINLMGWNTKTKLAEGLSITYKWFLENQEDFIC